MKINIVKNKHGNFVSADEDSEKKLYKIDVGEILYVDIKKIDRRSLEQNNLFWKCCTIVADNTDDKSWNTKEKVKEQCLIEDKQFDHWIHYSNPKTGEQMLNIKTKSISFENMHHLEACDFFTKSFEYMSKKIGITVDQLMEEAKK